MIIIAAALLCVVATWFFVRWNFASAVAFRIDPSLAESKQVTEWLAALAPSDPQNHISNGRVLEKTFDSTDLAAAVASYEKAVELSPHNYMIWIDLGRARSINGDQDGAHRAYEQAYQLAPNYAAVQWVYGNSLIRRGNTDDGFRMIAKASASKPEYAPIAAATALQFFDGDVAAARTALGDGIATNSALANVLSTQKRFDEAADAWSRLNAASDPETFKTLGDQLISRFAEAKRFRKAAVVAADIRPESERPSISEMTNGGFESGVKLKNAAIFEWQIAEGSHPQIGVGEGQAHGGKFNLVMLFNTFETAATRSVSQTVAVEPGRSYRFEVFYRADLKTSAAYKWEIVDASTSTLIAATPPLENVGDWMSSSVEFPMPSSSDGIIIRLTREGCAGPTCPVNGRLSFDDFSLRQVTK